MLLEQARAPWWQWALFSLGGLVITVICVVVGLVALAFQGVDFTEYMELARPPLVRSGLVGGLFALIIAGQKLGPVLMIWLFRPAAAVVLPGLRRLADPAGMARRLALGVALFAVLQVIWHFIGPKPVGQWNMVGHLAYAFGRGGQFWPILWLTVAIGLVAPFAEELLYRGLVFGFLRRRWSFWAAAAVSALFFGLPHGPNSAVPAALMGFYFAWQVERDGSLHGAIVLHILNNLAAVAILIYPYL